MQNISPTRGIETITLPTFDHFEIENLYCPITRYHIYQDYPTLLDKMQGDYTCGSVISTHNLNTLFDFDLEYQDRTEKASEVSETNQYDNHWEMVLADCQQKCNDDASCKRFAFGKAGAVD